MQLWIFLGAVTLGLQLEPSCNYNGGRADPAAPCECERPWTGPTCDVLDLAPITDRERRLGYQYVDNGMNVTSWGGSVVRGDDGTYHMYASEISMYCGMNVWLANSMVVHAVSPDPRTKPFERKGVVHGVFAHEPAVARAPTGEYVVFFTAAAPPHQIPVHGESSCLGCENGISVESCGTDSDERDPKIFLPTFMVYSKDPDGPWSDPVMLPDTNQFADSNFAHVINQDGSLLALQRGQVVYSPDWRNVSAYHVVNNWPDGGEDPFVWRDQRNGVYHALVHVARINTTGLHYFSEDGVQWEASPGKGAAYTSFVQYADGSEHNFGCRERPHLVFDKNGTIMGLINGASPVHCHIAGSDDHSWTMLQLMKP